MVVETNLALEVVRAVIANIIKMKAAERGMIDEAARPDVKDDERSTENSTL